MLVNVLYMNHSIECTTYAQYGKYILTFDCHSITFYESLNIWNRYFSRTKVFFLFESTLLTKLSTQVLRFMYNFRLFKQDKNLISLEINKTLIKFSNFTFTVPSL